MGNRFASGKYAIPDCDRCGQRIKLRLLKELVVKTKRTGLLVCPACWEEDHPQLLLGMYPIEDPQAIQNPRPDVGLVASRDIQWGWAPVGGGNPLALPGIPNTLSAAGAVGDVTIAIT